MLAEKNHKNKCLAEKFGKNPSTISQWCTNERQPSIETLAEIASTLDFDVRELLTATK